MRWKSKTKKVPLDGEERIITKFCWLPEFIIDNCVWLETVTIKQRCYFINWIDGRAYMMWRTIEEII
jgi:hypothetical protein